MLIEFIGPTGAGKSTISRRVVDSLRARPLDIRLLHTGGLGFDLVAVPGFLSFSRRQRTFCLFAARVVMRDADSLLSGLNLFRHFAKKMGMYRLLRSRPADQHILWEEGTLHAAHNLFVHVGRRPRLAEIHQFARDVPKPDLAVYVRAPIDVIVSRILARGHRRLKRGDHDVHSFTQHAHETFEALASLPVVRPRLLVVHNDHDGAAGLQRVVDHIADCIHETLTVPAR
jgi:thymidylate kinase